MFITRETMEQRAIFYVAAAMGFVIRAVLLMDIFDSKQTIEGRGQGNGYSPVEMMPVVRGAQSLHLQQDLDYRRDLPYVCKAFHAPSTRTSSPESL